jgi:outer membrane receptor protein involved in Fe transport
MKTRLGTVILLTVCLRLLFPAAQASGERARQKAKLQTIELLETIISIDLDRVPLGEALGIIAEKARFKLNYNRSRIPIHMPVSVTMEHTPVEEVLEKILQNTGTELKITAGGQLAVVPSKPKLQKQPKKSRGDILGTVCDSQSQEPLPNVTIEVMDSREQALTDSQGRFRLSDLHEGEYALRLACPGYDVRIFEDILVRNDVALEFHAELCWTPVAAESETVDVFGRMRTAKNPVGVSTLSAKEIQGAPATAGGVSRWLPVLPGISFIRDENMDYVIRGGCPIENGFTIDNIEVPGIDHLSMQGSNGGFYSSLNPNLIQRMDVLAGCFSSDYGDRLSSITRITLREGNREQPAGRMDLSLAGMGTELEGPLPGRQGAWVISLRKSYLGLLQGISDLDEVPNTLDSQLKVTWDISPRHKLNLLNYYTRGMFQEISAGDAAIERMEQVQNTAGIAWTAFWNPHFFSMTSFSYSSQQRADGELGNWRFKDRTIWSVDERVKFIHLRNSNTLALHNNLQLDFGLQLKAASERLDHVIHQPMKDFLGRVIHDSRLDLRYQTTNVSLFSSYIITPFRHLTLTLGLRGDYSSVQKTAWFSPRFSLICRVNPRLTLSGGAGVFHQNLPMNVLAYNPDTVRLKPMQAVHFAGGLEYAAESGTRFSLEAYAKEYRRLPISPDEPRMLLTDLFLDRSINNELAPVGYLIPARIQGTGTAYSRGIELTYQRNWWSNLFTALSASYFRSRYTDLLGVTRNRIYDNRYVLNLVVKYAPHAKWELSAGWTLMGGAPYTPVDIRRSWEAREWILQESQYLLRRYPDYNRLNLRISRLFLAGSHPLHIYVDIMNVLNQRSTYNYGWDRWYGTWESESQLGIIPILGFKYEF